MADAYGIKFYPQSGQFAKQIGEFTADDKLLASGAVSSGKVADNAINATNITDGAVTSGKYASGSIPSAAISDGAVTSGKYASGSIPSEAISDGAVTSTAISDGAVTSGKYASGSIPSAAISDGAITSPKLASGITVPFARATIDDTTYTAAEPISGGYAISINSAGELITADAYDPARMPAIGFATANCASGDPGAVITQGVLDLPAYNFSGGVRKTIFVGSGGWPTVQSPSASGTWIQWMGMVAGVSKLSIDVETQIYGNAPVA